MGHANVASRFRDDLAGWSGEEPVHVKYYIIIY